MPKIAIFRNLVFYIVAYDLTERLHLHISNSKNYNNPAKIWIDDFTVFERGGLSEKEIALSINLIEMYSEEILATIENFKQGNKTKTIKFEL